MDNDDLKKIFDGVKFPEPDSAARERAVSAALKEFDRATSAEEKNVKGFFRSVRLTEQKPKKGGSVMRRTFILPAAGFAVALIALGIFITPEFISYRKAMPVAPVSVNESVVRQTAQPAPVMTDQLAEDSEANGAGAAAPVVSKPQPEMTSVRPAMDKLEEKRTFVASAPKAAMVKQMAGRMAPEPMPAPRPQIGRDRFEAFTPNPVKQTAVDPVSTFSIDVDTASYAFVRKALNRGVLPRKDAVRIEEMINYFSYDYPLPENRTTPFKPTVSVFPTPWNANTRLLHIGIRGFDLPKGKKPASNLVFLLDVSGSMNQPDKLPLLKNAFRMLVDTLSETDRVAIVVYAGSAGTVLEPTEVKEKGKILAALDRLRAGGSTAGGEGIRQAYALAEANFIKDGVNRVLLATDGDFNVGIRNPEELKDFVARKRKTGIFLSVLGFGQGNYNDALMQKLAQNGNGNAAYIDTLNEARKVLVEEAAATLFPIAKDVKIQIEFNPAKVAEYRLIGYETRKLRNEDFNNDAVDAGDIGAGHTVTALYEITPADAKEKAIDDLRYGDAEEKESTPSGRVSDEYAFVKIRYKLPDQETSRKMTQPVDGRYEFDRLENVSSDTRFAAAVAAFGQLLRGGTYTKDFSYDDVIELATPARGTDRFGYRTEFLNLVRLAKTAQGMEASN